MALKQTWTRRMTERDLNELQILGRMSERRHRHIVELVGSYTQQQRFFEIGILMWPVAHADLSAVLHDFIVFTDYANSTNVFPPPHDADDVRSAMMSLQFMLPDIATTQALFERAADLLIEGSRRIRQSAGCIATAISFLHDHGIRHKDLKPSQVLLSSYGLWITDFGWSRDMSNLDQSTTSGGDNTTLKYQAPERAKGLRCGWPEDVFTLGCLFFELGYAVSTRWWPPAATARPWLERGWYFHTHLDDVHDWLHTMRTVTSNLFRLTLGGFLELVFQMLAAEPEDRPSSSTISSILCGGLPLHACFTSVDFRIFSCQECHGIEPETYRINFEFPPPLPPSDPHYSQHHGSPPYHEESTGNEYNEPQFYHSTPLFYGIERQFKLDDNRHNSQYHGAASDMSGLWSGSTPNGPAAFLQLPPESPQPNNQIQRLVDPGTNITTPSIQMRAYGEPGDSHRDVPLQVDRSQAFRTQLHNLPYEADQSSAQNLITISPGTWDNSSDSSFFSGQKHTLSPVGFDHPIFPLPTTDASTYTLPDPTSFQHQRRYQIPPTYALAHYQSSQRRLIQAPLAVHNDIDNDTISCPVPGCNAEFHGENSYYFHHLAMKHPRTS